jgi:hypothetical protein
MGTALGYIVTQDLYIAWGHARGTLENSLWFSLASIEPSDSGCKVALTEEFSPFGGLKVSRYPSQQTSIRRSLKNLRELLCDFGPFPTFPPPPVFKVAHGY